MTEERNTETRHVIEPGPCPPQGCPPPNEIVCIKTKKVYQECKQSEVFELKVYEWNPRTGSCNFSQELTPPEGATSVVSCRLAPMFRAFETCHENNLMPNGGVRHEGCNDYVNGGSCCEVRRGRIRFNLNEDIDIPVSLTFDTGQTVRGCVRIEAPFTKTVGMSRAGTHPMFECEVDLWVTRCLLCFIEENTGPPEVHCCINVVIAFKLYAEVQLLIPAYGFCTPPDCEEVLGECPPALDEWPPYPSQDVDDNGTVTIGGCVGCK
ncbi:hypothetical protein MFMK1_001112 [Metallumcola ferriviriculae]|uniref:Uncharacterized protein n=1 Tax=Metallumcola ferriviriculae TaxID=3039180 RepID=A0AAU0UKL1_9FIRM|nr:hypothetical protein MFMK1_001112 [Desulfitibacteraceae bacterium MK1]